MPPRRFTPATIAVLVISFLLLRAILFAFTTAGEYQLYKVYAEGVRDHSLAYLYEKLPIEYPPLGVVFGVVALEVTDALPSGAEVLVAWRPNESYGLAGDRYQVGLGIVLFAVDLGCIALICLIARRVYPDDTPMKFAARIGIYVAGTTAIGLIIYDRQDLPVGLIALLAIGAFARGWSIPVYALLTIGTAYKLVPVLLFPLFVFAFAAARSAPGTTRSFLIATVKQALIAGVILAAYPVLSWLCCGGERSFLFLTYHSDRGLQLEAASAWVAFAFDPNTEVGFAYLSHTLRGGLADKLAKASSIATVLAALFTVVVVGRGFWRAATGPRPPARNELVQHLITGSLLAWVGFILFTKVGSPQYPLWIAPLVPLLPLRGRDRWCAGVILASMVITTIIFPCAYFYVRGAYTDDPQTWTGPNWYGMTLLIAKSLTLTVSFVWLAVIAWKSVPAGTSGGNRE